MVGKGIKVGTGVKVIIGVLEGNGVTVSVAVGVAEGKGVTLDVAVGIAEGADVADAGIVVTVSVAVGLVSDNTPSFPGTSDCDTVQPTRITIVKSSPIIDQ